MNGRVPIHSAILNKRRAQMGGCPEDLYSARKAVHSKPYAVCDDRGTQVTLLLREGQNNDDTGARHLLPSLLQAKPAIADCGYDADWPITTLEKTGCQTVHSAA